AQDSNVKDDDIAAAGFDAIENVREVVEIELVADGDEDVARLGANGFGSEFSFDFEIELIHLDMGNAATMGALFRNRKNDVEKEGEGGAGHCGDGLSEKVDDCNQEEGESDERQTERNLHAANGEVERNLKVAGAGASVAKNEDREAVHGKGPDNAECVEVREEGDVAAADENSCQLKQHNDIYDAVAR